MSHYDCPCMEKCPLHWAMSRIGGKWKVQILCSVANAGTIRYNALRAKLDGISNTVLSAALRELEGDGLVRRLSCHAPSPRNDYRGFSAHCQHKFLLTTGVDIIYNTKAIVRGAL